MRIVEFVFELGQLADDQCKFAVAAEQVLHEETNGEALVSTGVGQHQMWAAQWYKLDSPRQWATSGGLGSMGFGLPAALGAAVAYDGTDKGRPKKVSLLLQWHRLAFQDVVV